MSTREHRLIIAIDYGTTFTGVALATPNTFTANLDDIEVIRDWGDDMMNHEKIPSVISYSPASNEEQQWGTSLSPEAVTMVNTKLELDNQDNKLDELDLIIQVLDGMKNLRFDHVVASKGYPEYTWKNPQDIVSDYLSKVFYYVEGVVSNFKAAQVPFDLVMTVPVTWSYRAKNSTLHAIRNAGFNNKHFPNLRDTVMVTEPEAAAIYTARYLKDKLGQEFLKVGECFVLCDAGGGTVDVVSYKVTKLEPLELERVTLPTGAKCGSIYIDTNFKRWLRGLLTDRYYRELDNRSAGQKISAHSTESKEMRAIMKKFDDSKRKFSKNAREMKMDLPNSLGELDIGDHVVGGQLTITNENMQSFFDPCVNQIIDLIQSQIQQVERLRQRVKSIFLVGGLGESRYLQEELEFSMRLRRIKLHRPDTSWTAVVRGAVILGIEKLDQKGLTFMKTCERSYGLILRSGVSQPSSEMRGHYTDMVTNKVIANGQLTWLIRKGDLLLSDTHKETEEAFSLSFTENDSRKFSLPIYEYPDDDIPDNYGTAHEELSQAAVLSPDFSKFPIDDFDRFENPRNGKTYYTAHCVCKAVLSATLLTFSVIWNDIQICSVELLESEEGVKQKEDLDKLTSRLGLKEQGSPVHSYSSPFQNH